MDFLVTGLPRSGTTWASVWLMDHAICLHDPLCRYTPEDLKAYDPKCIWGIVDTNIWALPADMDFFDCPKAVITRPLTNVCKSLERLGAPLVTEREYDLFKKCPGARFDYEELFDVRGARALWKHLRPDRPMDEERWDLLRQVKMEPNFGSIHHDPKVIARIMKKMRQAAQDSLQ